ncbi:hypothetical protein S40293_03972 [Stachybotrys chartarum IBT 40293]|nr:hypothetical protein S40293_03972 [Stachybotrys chartarum IBT 40293]
MANTLALGCVVALAIWATTAAYRIWLHPLSRYPGSKTAAVSNSWWELYWNYYRNGEMIFEIERLHKVHGPVIRIGVNDIHISDPRVFYDITQVKSTFTKSADFYQHISFPKTLIGESDVAWHRTRRRVLAPALTGSRLQGLAEDVMLKSRHLMARFEEAAAKSSPVCINAAMKAFTMDIISPIVLGQDFECVLDDQFHNQFSEHLRAAFSVGWISTAFPLTSAFALKVASYTSVSIFPLPLLTFKRKCLGITKKYIENAANQANDGQTNSKKSPVIDLLMDAGAVDGHVVPALSELNDELIMLLIAGNDTTSHSLIFGIYQISTNPTVQRRLVEELVREFPTLEEDVTYVRAKKLEFLVSKNRSFSWKTKLSLK